ncbi:unnamed protein product [Ostreobium quekettii]|uniref:Protein yippee-like n=1 Tax=Ostreobium quekettii TaxID=121088 RepID=A0A8S1J0X4_9CHLO|nr:unnamed protein product [Ostreobium quekettii]
MTTGMHIVRDAFCTKCMFPVGWKYEEARCKAQKYKEGKYILERSKMLVQDHETVCAAAPGTSPSTNVADSGDDNADQWE